MDKVSFSAIIVWDENRKDGLGSSMTGLETFLIKNKIDYAMPSGDGPIVLKFTEKEKVPE